MAAPDAEEGAPRPHGGQLGPPSLRPPSASLSSLALGSLGLGVSSAVAEVPAWLRSLSSSYKSTWPGSRACEAAARAPRPPSGGSRSASKCRRRVCCGAGACLPFRGLHRVRAAVVPPRAASPAPPRALAPPAPRRSQGPRRCAGRALPAASGARAVGDGRWAEGHRAVISFCLPGPFTLLCCSGSTGLNAVGNLKPFSVHCQCFLRSPPHGGWKSLCLLEMPGSDSWFSKADASSSPSSKDYDRIWSTRN